MNIRQIAAGDPQTALFLNTLLKYSPVLDKYIEFYTGAGTASSDRKEQDALTASGRALNSSYSAQVVAPEYNPVGRKIFGAQIKLDVAYEVMGMDIPSEFLSQLKREAIGLGTAFNNKLINGDSATTATDFNGLKKLIQSAQIIEAAANGLEVQLGNDNTAKKSQQAFLELLNDAIAMCSGVNKVILVNAKSISRITTIGREYINWQLNEFGVPVGYYNQVPILNVEGNGNTIIPFTETQGSDLITGSLYVASFEEKAGVSFFTTKEGLKVYPMTRENNFYDSHIDFIADSTLLRDKASIRLKGFRFSS